jgi:hypothetical protein
VGSNDFGGEVSHDFSGKSNLAEARLVAKIVIDRIAAGDVENNNICETSGS